MTTYGDTPPSNLLTLRTAMQHTLTARPLRGQVPSSGARQLLTYSEDFSNAAWIKQNTTATPVEAPDGSMTACKLVVDSGTDGSQITNIRQAGPAVVASRRNYLVAKAGEHRYLNLAAFVGNSANFIIAQFDLQSGTVVSYRVRGSNYAADSGPTIVPHAAGDGWYECRVGGSTLSVAVPLELRAVGSDVEMPGEFGITLEQSFQLTNDGTSGIYIWHPQLADADYVYQKSTEAYDITQAGSDPVYHAYYDTGDDIFPQSITLPPISGGQILIASPNGIWIYDFDFAGGEWSCGPTTYIGGPSGIIASPVFDKRIMGIEIYAQPMTAVQRYDRIAYWMLRGSPGLWNPSAEQVLSPSSATGWTPNGSNAVTTVDDHIRLTSGAAGGIIGNYPVADLGVNDLVLMSGEVKASNVGGSGAFVSHLSAPNSGTQTSSATNTLDAWVPFSFVSRSVVASGNQIAIRIASADGAGRYADFRNMSARKLTLNTDPLS